MNKINISIPQPCHENWEAMTSVEKGKFCASCQKKVFDFTTSSDKEIISAFKQNQNLCGRFLNTQLNRDIVQPKEKSSLWLATTSAIVSLIGLNSQEVFAQGEVKTEQTDRRVLLGKPAASTPEEFEISGIVSDETGPLPGANVIIKNSNRGVQTDMQGRFKILVKKGDILVSMYTGYEKNETLVSSTNSIEIYLKSTGIFLGETIIAKKRTFLGKIFHSIGNIFR